jgi:hypothetical protein
MRFADKPRIRIDRVFGLVAVALDRQLAVNHETDERADARRPQATHSSLRSDSPAVEREPYGSKEGDLDLLNVRVFP